MKTLIESVEIADFDEEGTTISVTAKASETETFHIQTVDGEYNRSLGCWIIANTCGEDLDQDDYGDFDFEIIINEAEKLAMQNCEGEENSNYINKDATPYEKRFSL